MLERPGLDGLDDQDRLRARAVAEVLPFRTNSYVIDELINPVFSEVPVIVTSNGVVGPGAPVTITAAAPGINQDSAGHAVVVNANGTLNSPGSPEK